MLSEDEEALPKDRPFATTGAESGEETGEGDKTAPAANQNSPGEQGSHGKSGEKAPKPDDILYDSV